MRLYLYVSDEEVGQYALYSIEVISWGGTQRQDSEVRFVVL